MKQMKIKTYKEYIKELWSKGVERNMSDEKRLEDGKKVMTSIGVEILLHNQSCDYEWFIKEICDGEYGDDLRIDYYRHRDFSSDEIEKIKSWTAPYAYEINSDVIIGFGPYDDMLDGSVFDEDDLDEHDYISICKGIATAIKNLNDEYEFQYIGNDGADDIYGFRTIDEEEIINIVDIVHDNVNDYDDEWYGLRNEITERYCSQFRTEYKYDIMMDGYEGQLYAKMSYSTLKLVKPIHEYTKNFLKTVLDAYEIENVNELWSKGIERNMSGKLRQEDGKKVMTKLGIEIIVKNYTFDYDNIIKEICNSNPYGGRYGYTIKSPMDYIGKMRMLDNDELPYEYKLTEKHVIKFKEYDKLDGRLVNLSELCEDDYITMCKAIVDVLRKTRLRINTGRQIEFILISQDEAIKVRKKLIEDDDLEYGEVIIDDFKDDMYNKAKDKVDIHVLNNKIITMNYNYYTLLNYEKILKYTHKFFRLI